MSHGHRPRGMTTNPAPPRREGAKTPHRTGRRSPAAAVAAMLALLLALPATALAQDSGWPQSRGDGLQSSRLDVQGPEQLSPKWIRDDTGYVVNGTAGGTNTGSDYFLQLDGEGHLLAVASQDEPREDDEFNAALLAFDVDSGETAYVIDDADIECKPAVADGVLWAPIEIAGDTDPHRDPTDVDDASFAIVGFDPEDGQPMDPPLRWSGTRNNPLGRCHFAFGLQVAANGNLLFAQWTGVHENGEPDEHDGQMLISFAATDTGIAPAWSTPLSDCGPADDFVLAPPAGAPNAQHLYILQNAMDSEHECQLDVDDNEIPQIWTLDADSGEVVARTDLPGRRYTYVRGNVADDRGGVVVTTWTDFSDVGHMLRLVDDGSGQLLQGWRIDEPRDKDSCTADVCRIPRAVATQGDRLLGVVGNQLLSLDLLNGTLQWRYQLSTGVNIGDIVLDANGTAYVETSTGASSNNRALHVEAVSAAGTRTGFLPADTSLAVGGVRVLGPLSDDGTLFGWSQQRWFALDSGPAACPDAVPEDGFADADSSPHEETIDCVVWWDIANGTSRDTYKPGGRVTRAQMATFVANLVRNAGGQLPADPRDHFEDDNHSPHEANINALAEAGLASGVSRSSYAPNRRVTRAQMATFLVRSYLHTAPLRDSRLIAHADFFSDDDSNAHEENINHVAEMGVAGGISATQYGPGRDLTRAQMATFIARLLDVLTRQRLTDLPS